MTTYTRRPEYRPGETLRDCGVCGLRFYFPSEFELDPNGTWRCKKFCTPRKKPEGEYPQVRDKLRASVGQRLREMPPPPGAREFTSRPTFNDEASLFDFLTRWGSYDTVSATSGQLAGVSQGAGAAAETCRYLYGLIVEAKRETRWLTQARASLLVLADWLLTQQFVYAGVAMGWPMYGGFQAESGHLDVATSDVAASGGLALCRAHQLTGAQKYLDAARRAAHFLRRAQCGAYRSDAPSSSSDAAGAVPWSSGMWTHTARWLPVPDIVYYDHLYYPGDLVGVEFLTVLKGIVGDEVVGDAVAPWTFTAPTAAPISTMIADAMAFWANGVVEAGGVNPVNGLSTSAPYEFFNSYPAAKVIGVGNHAWQYAADTSVTARNWALALRSLHAVEGASARVLALYSWLTGFGANAAHVTPAGTTDAQLAEGLTGAFDPKLAPATLMDARALQNGSAIYDLAAAGCLAPIAASQNKASLLALKRQLQHTTWRTDTGDPGAQQDDLRLMGRCGLSWQSYAASGIAGVVNYRPAYAAMVGNLYRYT